MEKNCEQIIGHPFPRWRFTWHFFKRNSSIKTYKIALNSIADGTIDVVSKHQFETERSYYKLSKRIGNELLTNERPTMRHLVEVLLESWLPAAHQVETSAFFLLVS